MKKNRLFWATGSFAAFAMWTLLLRIADVQCIGPNGSRVGFATVNGYVHSLFGVHMTLYHLTDWLGLVPVAFGVGFAILGLMQWIQRRNILKVDRSILVLGVFYLVVLAVYLVFEKYVVNYRPVLINNYLEASYPSSTTLLVMTVMPTAALQLHNRIVNKTVRSFVVVAIIAFTVLMVAGRLVSGVHWLTDIIGGAMLSTGLVLLYESCC